MSKLKNINKMSCHNISSFVIINKLFSTRNFDRKKIICFFPWSEINETNSQISLARVFLYRLEKNLDDDPKVDTFEKTFMLCLFVLSTFVFPLGPYCKIHYYKYIQKTTDFLSTYIR